ncbi:MAG: TIGR03085 family metal-binding protein [Nocardioides sp.]|uniref:TIGR03085 family metal-binding protein n=1 Tax=Nocardioides sp. TaxID=35761 RepID=UPI0039E5D222
MSGTYLARREREALCDLALEVGPDAPTLCEGWTVVDLVTHLLVRERTPWAAPGIVFPALSGLTDRAMDRLARRDFDTLVRQLRGRGLTPMALPPIDKLANTMEYVVHHEDIRRAQPDWVPRTLDERDLATIWSGLRAAGKGLVKRIGVPVVIRRSDIDLRAVLVGGADPVVVSGLPVEVTMFLFGRDRYRDLDLTGPDDAVAALRQAKLGF